MAKARVFQARMRYDENWHGQGEHYVFENKWSDEDEWGLDTAFPLVDDRIHYTALTKIRDLPKLAAAAGVKYELTWK